MEAEEIDISKIKKPTPVGRKPAKPRQPAKSITKIHKEREVFWRTGKLGDVNLLDALQNIPKDVPLEECIIWLEEHRNGGYYGTRNKRVHIGRVTEKENPKYAEAWNKYEKALAEYNTKVKSYEEKKAKYDKEMKSYLKYKEIVDFREDQSKLSDKIKKLSKKL